MSEAAFHGALLRAWLALAAVVFVALFFVEAPYGRHGRAGWGPALPARRGWLLMDLPSVFALCTAANLAPRAIAHHRWYRERFPDYPQERKALIPWLL